MLISNSNLMRKKTKERKNILYFLFFSNYSKRHLPETLTILHYCRIWTFSHLWRSIYILFFFCLSVYIRGHICMYSPAYSRSWERSLCVVSHAQSQPLNSHTGPGATVWPLWNMRDKPWINCLNTDIYPADASTSRSTSAVGIELSVCLKICLWSSLKAKSTGQMHRLNQTWT